MYDPTVFENLKVAFENRVYDLETIDRKIKLLNRLDKMDFAILTRDFGIQFHLVNQPSVTAEIQLHASLQDLASEILEIPETNPGCQLTLRFTKHIHNEQKQCQQIEEALSSIWKDEITITQTISHVYGKDSLPLNKIDVTFSPKLTEDHMGEIVNFLAHVVESLKLLFRI